MGTQPLRPVAPGKAGAYIILNFLSAMFPFSAERNPERKRDESNVGAQALFFDVQPIQPKLLFPRQIPRRKDLRQPRQAWNDLMSCFVSRYLFKCDDFAISVNLELLGQKRSGADKTHLTNKDVPK